MQRKSYASGFAMALCVATVLTPASGGAAPPPVTFKGEMAPGTVRAALDELDRTKADSIRVTSNGGVAANHFAQELRKRGTTVVVVDYCVALCAQAVFIGARKRVVEDGAFIAFHNTVVAGNILIRRQGQRPAPGIDLASAADVSAYESWGLGHGLLLDQFMGLDPSCWWTKKEGATATGGALKAVDLWVPPRAWVEKTAKARFTGWWPSNAAEADAAAKRTFPKQRVRYGPAPSHRTFFAKGAANSCAAMGTVRS